MYLHVNWKVWFPFLKYGRFFSLKNKFLFILSKKTAERLSRVVFRNCPPEESRPNRRTDLISTKRVPKIPVEMNANSTEADIGRNTGDGFVIKPKNFLKNHYRAFSSSSDYHHVTRRSVSVAIANTRHDVYCPVGYRTPRHEQYTKRRISTYRVYLYCPRPEPKKCNVGFAEFFDNASDRIPNGKSVSVF